MTRCPGGSCRAASVLSALKHVPGNIDWVAVHDAARPLVSQALIARTIEAAKEHGAAVPAMPVSLTIKQGIGPLPAQVVRTVPRHELWAMQTPQIARLADLLEAFERCPIPLYQVPDDVQLRELQGKEVVESMSSPVRCINEGQAISSQGFVPQHCQRMRANVGDD